MTASLRLLSSLVVLLAGLVGLGSTPLGWWSAMLPTAPRTRGVEETRSMAIPPSRTNQLLLRRISLKTEFLDQLAGGTLSLFEVAAWFRFLNLEPATLPDYGWRTFPGASDEEKVCRQVLHWHLARMSSRLPSSEAVAMHNCLEEELAKHLARHGRVILPDVVNGVDVTAGR